MEPVTMPQFLYRIQPVRSGFLTRGATEDESRIVKEHFLYVKKLTEDSVVFLAGRTTNTDTSSFGIVKLDAESEEAARKIMNDDPAVKDRVFRAELFPYSNSLIRTGAGSIPAKSPQR
jgi:uncharacterized protein YciI